MNRSFSNCSLVCQSATSLFMLKVKVKHCQTVSLLQVYLRWKFVKHHKCIQPKKHTINTKTQSLSQTYFSVADCINNQTNTQKHKLCPRNKCILYSAYKSYRSLSQKLMFTTTGSVCQIHNINIPMSIITWKH